jgi:hypothetical protein
MRLILLSLSLGLALSALATDSRTAAQSREKPRGSLHIASPESGSNQAKTFTAQGTASDTVANIYGVLIDSTNPEEVQPAPLTRIKGLGDKRLAWELTLEASVVGDGQILRVEGTEDDVIVGNQIVVNIRDRFGKAAPADKKPGPPAPKTKAAIKITQPKDGDTIPQGTIISAMGQNEPGHHPLYGIILDPSVQPVGVVAGQTKDQGKKTWKVEFDSSTLPADRELILRIRALNGAGDAQVKIRVVKK